MKLRRMVGLVDIAIVVVVLFVFGMPPREMLASPALKGTEQDAFAVALAEARTIDQPADPGRAEELAQKLGDVGFKDWAVEAGIAGSLRAKAAPDRWRALLAASVGYIDRLEPKEALDYAQRALAACELGGPAACPAWEKARMEIYREHLDAGVDAQIDPKRNPKAFREAGEARIRTIRINGAPR